MIGSAAVYSRPALDLATYVCVILACAEAIAGPNSNKRWCTPSTRSTFHSPAASTPVQCPCPSELGQKADPEPPHDFEFHLAQDQRRIDRRIEISQLAYLNREVSKVRLPS